MATSNLRVSEILLFRNVSIPKEVLSLYEGGEANILKSSFRGIPTISIRFSEGHSADLSSSDKLLLTREPWKRDFYPAFDTGKVISLTRPGGERVINHHLCFKCMKKTGRQLHFLRSCIEGDVFQFGCPCGKKWKVTLPPEEKRRSSQSRKETKSYGKPQRRRR